MTAYEAAVTNRLKTARGHLEGVIRMVDDHAYCPDVMKQLSAVQGILEGTSREVLRHHLETCVARAMQEGRVEEIVDELMATLKYDKRVLAPQITEPDAPTPNATPRSNTMTTETISVPEIHCNHCKGSIEGALSPIDGVERALVDVDGRNVSVTYDEAVVDRARLVEAIVDQGYEVP